MVLIEGETGTGKDHVAKAIHVGSRRHGKPFLAVDCAALTESLMTSQLFGHRRGAFTGALSDQPGCFEAASGGTILLDEIGDMPPSVQTGLLRVLEQREVMRLGDTRPTKVDVRVLAATHRDLGAEVAAGRFREDLFYRIRVARVQVPPLRERAGVRELRNVLEYALMHCREGPACRSPSVMVSKRLLMESSADPSTEAAKDRWPGPVRVLHWTVAALVIVILAAGLLMVGMDPTDPMRRNLGRVHTVSGNLVGLLMVARLAVLRRTRRPAALAMSPLHQRAVAVVHALLYVLTFGVIATGLGTGLRTTWHEYLKGELPRPPSFEDLASREVHEVLAFVLASLVAAHVVGVVVQEVRGGGVLRRMLRFFP